MNRFYPLLAGLLCLLTLPAEETLFDAIRRAPESLALQRKTEAARHTRDAAGLYPDAEVEVMYSRAELPNGDENPMAEILLRQPLPKPGERAAEREMAQARAEMRDAEAEQMLSELLAETVGMLIAAQTADRRSELLTQQAARTEQALASFDARIGTGGDEMGGKLRLQNNLSALRVMIDDEKRMREDLHDELRARLALPPGISLPDAGLPEVEETAWRHSPEYRMLNARRDEARAMARSAQASARPMTAIALRYEREEESMGTMQTVGVAFMSELPFRARRRARSEMASADAEIAAADAEAEVLRNRWEAQRARVERAERFARRVRASAEETRIRLNAEVDALLRAAGVKGMNASAAVLMYSDVLDRLTESEIRAINAESEARMSRAALWRYIPFPPTVHVKESP